MSNFFSIWVFFHEHSRITGLQGKGEDISLTPHFLDISRAITDRNWLVCESPDLKLFWLCNIKLFSAKNFNITYCQTIIALQIILTRLGLGLSYLREHKFKHSFEDTLNPFCSCCFDVETNTLFFFTVPCIVVIDAPSGAQLMIIVVIWQIIMIVRAWIIFVLFSKLSSDISINTIILDAAMNYISTSRSRKKKFF